MSAAFQCTTDIRFAEAALRYLKVVAEATRENPLQTPGLYSGSTGYILVLDDICTWEPRVRDLWKTMSESHRWQVEQIVRHAIPPELGAWSYDLIDGPSGVLLSLISCDGQNRREESRLKVALVERLALLLDSQLDGMPRARIDPSCYLPMQDHLRLSFPNGYVDLGLAHGIPGVLAALSAASQAGHDSASLRSALRNGNDWVWSQAFKDNYGENWASGVDVTDPKKIQKAARSAWCYGAPGVALALIQTALALDDCDSLDRARLALAASETRSKSQFGAASATLCHGVAGIVALSVSDGAADDDTINDLLRLFDSENPIGYFDLNDKHEQVDDPGYLTGASGVALTLLQASGFTSRVLSTATLLRPFMPVNSSG
jgi:lantibiotic modifying enzyme